MRDAEAGAEQDSLGGVREQVAVAHHRSDPVGAKGLEALVHLSLELAQHVIGAGPLIDRRGQVQPARQAGGERGPEEELFALIEFHGQLGWTEPQDSSVSERPEMLDQKRQSGLGVEADMWEPRFRRRVHRDDVHALACLCGFRFPRDVVSRNDHGIEATVGQILYASMEGPLLVAGPDDQKVQVLRLDLRLNACAEIGEVPGAQRIALLILDAAHGESDCKRSSGTHGSHVVVGTVPQVAGDLYDTRCRRIVAERSSRSSGQDATCRRGANIR